MIRTRYNTNRSAQVQTEAELRQLDATATKGMAASKPAQVSSSPAPEVVRELVQRRALKPSEWLVQTVQKLRPNGEPAALVLLTGGADIVGFRMRVAQSHARSDMLPSCFDHAALLHATDDKLEAYHVPLRELSIGEAAARNGIRRETDLRALAPSWSRTPNLAVLRFPLHTDAVPEVEGAAIDLVQSRASNDYLTPLSAWLAFIWGVQGANGNPLLASVSIPSAAFVEACFARARLDVAPGLTTRVVTPESIWQARFWAERYGDGDPAYVFPRASSGVPVLGYYVLQQPAASVTWPSAETTNDRYFAADEGKP